MCGPLKEPSQLLLRELSARLTVLENYFSDASTTALAPVLTAKVRGSLDALVEQLVSEGAISNGEQSTDPRPAVSASLAAPGKPRRARR